jgi:hypothetical protein
MYRSGVSSAGIDGPRGRSEREHHQPAEQYDTARPGGCPSRPARDESDWRTPSFVNIGHAGTSAFPGSTAIHYPSDIVMDPTNAE